MKEIKENVTTLLIVFISLKLIDFDNMTILDYILVTLACVYMIISVVSTLRRKK